MNRATGSRGEQRRVTVNSPAEKAVPSDRAVPHQLVNHRADNHVGLFSDSLSQNLLAHEVGVEDTLLRGTRAVSDTVRGTSNSTDLRVEATRVLDEEGTLIGADLPSPDRVRGTVNVRSVTQRAVTLRVS